MTHRGTLVVGVLCALAAPAAALATDHDGTAGSSDRACSCNCAQGQSASATPLTPEQQAARARARARARAAANARFVPTSVSTRITRTVAPGCVYTADARGGYRSNDPAGLRPGSDHVRDMDVTARASLACNGQPVRSTQSRFVFARTTEHELRDLMRARLTLGVPGSSCSFAPSFGLRGGALSANSVDGTCAHPAVASATSGYFPANNGSATIGTGGTGARLGAQGAVGGGPAVRVRGGADVTASDARPGTR